MTAEEHTWNEINHRCEEWHAARRTRAINEPQALLIAAMIVADHGLRGSEAGVRRASEVESYLRGIAGRYQRNRKGEIKNGIN